MLAEDIYKKTKSIKCTDLTNKFVSEVYDNVK